LQGSIPTTITHGLGGSRFQRFTRVGRIGCEPSSNGPVCFLFLKFVNIFEVIF